MSIHDNDLDFGPTLRGLRAGHRMFGQRYQLKRQLGRGGMGVVWLAQDSRLDREVALKFLPETVQGDPAAVDELKRETRRCLDLTHPNIVRIYDFEQGDDTAAIAMEYIQGQTLSELRLARPNRVFDVEDIQPWLETMIEALNHAHAECKMVHRDLKPANCMLDKEGQVKLADFGIACRISESFSRLSRGAASAGAGTLVYMSPQQLMGFPPKVTDDVYSLGATIYELLTGKPPFHSGSIERQIESMVPPTMTDRRKELEVESAAPIPEAWERAVAACLEKEPCKRPQTVGELLQKMTGRGMPALLETHAPKPLPISLSTQPQNPALPTGKIVTQGGQGTQSWRGIAAVMFLTGVAWAGYHFGYVVPRERELQKQAADQRASEAATAARLQKEKEAAERLAMEKDAELKRQQQAEKDARDKQMALQAELDRKEAEAQRQNMTAEDRPRMKGAKKPRVLKVPGEYDTIGSAVSAARKKDTVLVARGIYEERISLKNGVEIRGEDRDSCIIRNRSEDGSVIYANLVESASVTNLTIEQKLHETDERRYAAIYISSSSVTLDNCRVTCLSALGISVSGSGNPVIVNCQIENCAWDGITLGNTSGRPELRNNRCINNAQDGIDFGRGASGVAQSNICSNNHTGISVGGSNVSIIGNTCAENKVGGIFILDGASGVINGNTCDRNQGGIYARGRSTKVEIVDNQASGNLGTGFVVETICVPVRFENNTGSGNKDGLTNRSGHWNK
jgi:parallel beta-helix repeat protein